MSSSQDTQPPVRREGPTASRSAGHYSAEDVAAVAGILLRHGEFGTTQEASRRAATKCAHEVLAATTAAEIERAFAERSDAATETGSVHDEP